VCAGGDCAGSGCGVDGAAVSLDDFETESTARFYGWDDGDFIECPACGELVENLKTEVCAKCERKKEAESDDAD
jgi:hypothetical protein